MRTAVPYRPAAPHLRRCLGGPSVFALQFAVICVLGNVLGNVTWGLRTSGPSFVWEWLLGGALQLSVALSIAELSSTFPLTGACFSWLRWLSHDSLAWFTGYLLLFGYIAALADADFGLSSSLFAFAGVAKPPGSQIVIVALACLCVQTILTLLNLRIAARSVAVSVVVQVLSIGGIVLGLMFLGLRHSPSLLFNASSTTAHEHLPRFLLMLMIPAWTITAFDASGNFADEMTKPELAAPQSLMAAAAASFFFGTALIVVPLLAMTGLGETSRSSSALLFILQTRMGGSASIFFDATAITALFFLPLVLQLVAGRLLWAQARDGAWPSATWLSPLSNQAMPLRATVLCAGLAAGLCLAWPAVSALGTVWPALLPLAYAITIAAGLSAKVMGRLPEERTWNLGRWGMANDLLAIFWSLFLTALLPLFDAFHAVPLLMLIVLAGGLAYLLWVKPRWMPPQLSARAAPSGIPEPDPIS